MSAPPKTGALKRTTVKDQSGQGALKIGDLLSKAGYITAHQFDRAKQEQKKTGKRLSHILLDNGYIEQDTIVNFLSRQHNYPAVVISKEAPSEDAIKMMDYELCKKYMAFPMRVAGNTLQITMAEPTNDNEVEELQNALDKSLNVCVSSAIEIINAYKQYYEIDEEEYKAFFTRDDIEEEEVSVSQVDDFGSLVADAADDFEIGIGEEEEQGGEQFSASDAPIIKLVNGILVKAVQEGVSDIHIEPFEKSMQVRYRKDGALFKSMNLPLAIKNALIARMKILSGLNITERRVPQDGRIKMRIGRNKSVDFRVSTLPLLHGEGVVLRILDKSSLNVDLTMLGFEVNTFAALKRCLNRPQGLLLVTGPTGSGKTVTLYSALNSINREDIKILTAEDPVEFNFKGICQVNVNTEVGMTFAAALKAFLRQDPDIIMVGEIRDIDTAEIAMKAAMTGHLVFSTLHTNDAPSSIMRMVDIGIPPYLLAGSLTMVLAQRLGRKLCGECKTVMQHEPEELLAAGFKEEELEDLVTHGPVGCGKCNGLGYKGRVGIFELLEVTEEVAKAIAAEVPEEQLRKISIKEGMDPLRRAALKKVAQGVTSLEEALRRTVFPEESLPAYMVNPDVEEYEDGDVIIQEGNTDIDFFKLIRGKIAVLKSGKKIGEITEPGEYFGEMSAVSGEPRFASIVSMGRSSIKRYPGDKLMEVIEKFPDISKQIFKTMVTRLQKADRMVVKLAGGGGGGRKRPQPQVVRRA